jgi:hypothetical protein
LRLLDLFCGRWGWSRAFAARGWECVGVDLTRPPDIPKGCEFLCLDVLSLSAQYVRDGKFDFICASSPCEEFSVHGMKHFHPNPKYPENGIRLFEHTRALCEASGLPYVMENVRAAQQFVGNAVHHCGPFYLWGNAVPPLMPKGTKKAAGFTAKYPPTPEMVRRGIKTEMFHLRSSMSAKERANIVATIPPELAGCVADYATRLLEMRQSA